MMDHDKKIFLLELITGVLSIGILTAGVFISTPGYAYTKTEMVSETQSEVSTESLEEVSASVPSEVSSEVLPVEGSTVEETVSYTESVIEDSDDDSEDNPEEKESSTVSVKDVYRDYIFTYIRDNPGLSLESAEAYDINGDDIAELILLWKSGEDKRMEDVISIREGNAIRIFTATVEYYNLWLAENDEGELLAKIVNANGAEYIIHDFGYEMFGIWSDEKEQYCLSQRYTANDRDYEPVDWNLNLMYVSKDEGEEAWNRVVGDKVYIDSHDHIDVNIDESLEDDELNDEIDNVLAIVDNLENEISKEDDDYDGFIGKIYVIYLGPDGVNLHSSDDLREDSIDNDVGPVGAGYKENMNGDEFFVKESVKGNDDKKLYLLDNGRYISASPSMVAFVEANSSGEAHKGFMTN